MIQVSATSGKGIKSVLGSGYDVTGSFLSPSSMRQPVIDIDKMSDGGGLDFCRYGIWQR